MLAARVSYQRLVRAQVPIRVILPCIQHLARASYSHLVGRNQPLSGLYQNALELDNVRGPIRSQIQVRHMSIFSDFVANLKKGYEGENQPNKSKDGSQGAGQSAADANAENLKQAKETLEKTKEELDKMLEKYKESMQVHLSKITALFGKVAESDIAKQTSKISGQVAQEALKTASEVEKELGKTATYKKLAEGAGILKKELVDESILNSVRYRPYQKLSPEAVRKLTQDREQPVVEVKENADATGMVMHKSSIFEKTWNDFKDNNPLINRAFEWKMFYDESDNIFVRSLRTVTDKISEGISSMFKESELISVMKEIRKQDPSFDKEEFIETAHSTLIPILLESYLSADLKTLEKWCSEATYNVLSANIKQHTDLGLKTEYKILDIRDVDVFNALMTEHGPVLTVTCMVQQIMVAKNKKGEVVEGHPDNIEDVLYAFAFCREEGTGNIFNPQAAWKVMDFAVHLRRPIW